VPSQDRITHLAAPFKAWSLDDRIALVEELGLFAAYCPGCNCTLGSPYCHPLPEVNADRVQEDGCPSRCLYREEEESE
jgi:hypothetical protein